MKLVIKIIAFNLLSIFSIFSAGQEDNPPTTLQISDISLEYSIKETLLNDFVESYNFKCPEEIAETQLRSLLNDRYGEHQLNIMIESDKLDWRDIYVEARSGISCLTEGMVSKGY